MAVPPRYGCSLGGHVRNFVVMSALLLATPSQAQSTDAMTLANELGSILAAEPFCDLSYSQPAIVAFLEANVAPDDRSFPSLLITMVDGHRYQQDAMSPSVKTAYCAQIARLAEFHGFTD